MARTEDKKFHYIYKTTCNVTDKFYIGMHSTDDLEDGYKGSGKHLRFSICKYGIENHITKILEFLPSRKELAIRERNIVNEELLLDKQCMNLAVGGSGDGWKHLNSNSEIQRAKGKKGNATMKMLAETDPEWQAKRSENARKSMLERIENGTSIGWKKGIWDGRKHKPETIQKMKNAKKDVCVGENNSQYGTCWISNLETKECKKVKKDFEFVFPWVLGNRVWNKISRDEKAEQSRLTKEANKFKILEKTYNLYIELGNTRKVGEVLNISYSAVAKRIRDYLKLVKI